MAGAVFGSRPQNGLGWLRLAGWAGWLGWAYEGAGCSVPTTTSSAVRNSENGRGTLRNLRALPTLEIISDVADPPFFDLGASGPSRTI